jgi:hypothetical protein
MRACTKCGVTKALEDFPPVRRGEEKRQSWCRACFASYGKDYYRRNRAAQKDRLLRNVSARRAEVRAQIISYLAQHPCVDCGEADIIVLEFDHRGEKLGDISAYSGGGRSWSLIAAEIAKCDVRCANCHRRKTLAARPARNAVVLDARARRPGPGRARIELEGALGVRTCRVCAQTKPSSDFPFRSLARGTHQWICLSCQRTYTRRWYERNRKSHVQNVGARRRATALRVGRAVAEYLSAHPCVDCGERDARVLDFDHRREKTADVSALVHSGLSWERVAAEIAKCDVRCANCHRRRTATVASHYRTKASAAVAG